MHALNINYMYSELLSLFPLYVSVVVVKLYTHALTLLYNERFLFGVNFCDNFGLQSAKIEANENKKW